MSTQSERVANDLPTWVTMPVPIVSKHAMRCFLVQFNNKKTHGRFPIRTYEAYGCVFPGGHVALDSDDAPRRGYESRNEMEEELGKYGDVEVQELGEVGI